MRTPIHLTGDPDLDADCWASRLAGPSSEAAPAAAALAGLGTPRSLQLLVEATSLADAMCRGIAATAIGSHPLALTATERLTELAGDTSEYVAQSARWALETARAGARPAVPWLDDSLADAVDAEARIELLLGEARHVFHDHADGGWRGDYKDRYARLLLAEIEADPALAQRLLASGDRLLKMLTYRALELRRPS